MGAIMQGVYNDFYPRPPRGGRRLGEASTILNRGISIHALREEGDFFVPNRLLWEH